VVTFSYLFLSANKEFIEAKKSVHLLSIGIFFSSSLFLVGKDSASSGRISLPKPKGVSRGKREGERAAGEEEEENAAFARNKEFSMLKMIVLESYELWHLRIGAFVRAKVKKKTLQWTSWK